MASIAYDKSLYVLSYIALIPLQLHMH